MSRWFDWVRVIRDVAIVWSVAFFGRMVMEWALRWLSVAPVSRPGIIENTVWTLTIAGFLICGCLGRRHEPERMVHLAEVLAAYFLVTLVGNYWSATTGVPLVAWLKSMGRVGMLAFVGAGLSILVAPSRKTEPPSGG